MRYVSAVVLMALAGCASSSEALVRRRDAIRKFNGETNVPADLASYRSPEGVRQAKWGMTSEELVALKGAPVDQGRDFLLYNDEVDGLRSPTTYLFLNGQLAQVKSRFEADAELPTRLVAAMTTKYGKPVSDYNKGETLARIRKESEDLDVAMLILGGLTATTNGAPLSWGTGFNDRQALRQTLANLPAPSRDVLWASEETRAHLVSFDGRTTEIIWSNKWLGPRLVAQQRSAAGLADSL